MNEMVFTTTTYGELWQERGMEGGREGEREGGREGGNCWNSSFPMLYTYMVPTFSFSLAVFLMVGVSR